MRDLGANPGFGAAANEVLRLVEGDNGFFCFCHDDVALEPDAVRAARRGAVPLQRRHRRPEARRRGTTPACSSTSGSASTASARSTRSPSRASTTRSSTTRSATCSSLPSACLLVRADLFRALGGFDPAITFHGDDVDLCWRAHLSGARVVVAPQARVRHREELDGPPARPRTTTLLRARHRMRTRRHADRRRPAAGALARARRAHARRAGRRPVHRPLRRGVGVAAARSSACSRARRRCSPGAATSPSSARSTTPRSSASRSRGSARLTSYRRARDTETYVGADATVRRWRERSLGTTIAWIVVVVGILVASRTLIDTQGARRRRVPPAAGQPARAGGATSRRRGTRRPRQHRRQPHRLGVLSVGQRRCGCSGWASGSPSSSSGSSCSACGARGGWRRVFPSNRAAHRRPRRLRRRAAHAGRHLDGSAHRARRLRRGPVVRPPPARRRSASAPPIRRRPATTSSTAIIGLDRARAGPPHGAARARHRGSPSALAPAVLPVVALVVTLVLAVADAGRRRRLAHRRLDGRARPRRLRGGVAAQPAVVADVVVGRPRRAAAGRRRRAAGSSTWRRWRSGRPGFEVARARPVRAGRRRPRRRPRRGG